MSKTRLYSAFSRWLHWLVALAIGIQYFLAEKAEEALDQGLRAEAGELFANHKSLGMTIFTLAVIRLIWRGMSAQPMLPQQMPSWQILAAKLNHYLFYVLLMALPLTGWLGSSAAGYSASWFHFFSFPDMVAPSEEMRDMYFNWHEGLWTAFKILLLLHVLAALKHALVDGDGVLASMWSGRMILFAGLCLLLGWLAIQLVRNQLPQPELAATSASLAEIQASLEHSELDAWLIDYDNSRLVFTAGPLPGEEVESWRALVRFDAGSLDASGIDLQIAEAGQGDARLAGARFSAADILPRGDIYVASGIFSLAGRESPMQFNFKVSRSGPVVLLVGNANIDSRALESSALEPGSGGSAEQFVELAVSIVAAPVEE